MKREREKRVNVSRGLREGFSNSAKGTEGQSREEIEFKEKMREHEYKRQVENN